MMRNTLEHKITKAEVLMVLAKTQPFAEHYIAEMKGEVGSIDGMVIAMLQDRLRDDDVFNAVFGDDAHYEKALPR